LSLRAKFRHRRAEELDDVDGGCTGGPTARREGRVGFELDAASSNGEQRVRSRWSPWRAAIWGAGFGVLAAVGSVTMGNAGRPDAQLLVQMIFPAILFALGAAIRNWAVRASGLASSKALTRKIPGTPTTAAFWLCLGSVAIYGTLVSTWHLPAPPPVVWIFAGLVVGVVFHEGGHALCAVVSNIPVRLVSIGIGPLLLHGRVGETQLEWRLLPLGGYVAAYPFFDRRFSEAFFTIGGVLGNLFVIYIVSDLGFVAAADSSTARDSLASIVVAQVWFIMVSAYPDKTWNIQNDAWQLLQLLYRSSNTRDKLLEAYKWQIKRYRKGLDVKFEPTSASSRIMYQFFRPDRWANEQARRDSRDAMMRELARGNLRPEEEALVLDSLLTSGLVSGDTKLRPHLEEWSVRALSLARNLPTLIGTRGAVLVELGHHEAGKSLLLPLALDVEQHAALAEGKFDALMIQLFLARAEYALGNVERASATAAAAQRTAKTILSSPAVRMVMARFDREHWVNEVIE
jgi:Peptidase family M50